MSDLVPYRTFVLMDEGDTLELVESKRYLSDNDPLTDFEHSVDFDNEAVLLAGVLVADKWSVTGGPNWTPELVKS